MTAARERTVLIVDDNLAMAENLREIVEDEGVSVFVARSGKEALVRLAERHFDLLITDIRMPGMNGVELLEAARARWPRLPAIVMTAYSRDEVIEDAYTAGVLEVLSKPVDIEQLLSLVTRVTERGAPVLLVEDDRDLRVHLCEALLDVAQVVPHTASSVAAARRFAADAELRLAIIDVRLPDGDGVALGHELRAQRPDLPVVYITGYAEDHAGLPAILHATGMHLIKKPFSPLKLLELIRNLL